MSSLKPKHIDSDEEEETIEYVEITEKEKIKALRKAEKQRNNPTRDPPALQQAVKEQIKEPVPQKQSKKLIELKEVKEEKKKIEPANKDNHNRYERRIEENDSHRDQEKKNKYQQKPSNADKRQEVGQKPKYVEKPRNQNEEKIYYQNQRKYSAEAGQQQPKKINREIPKNRNQNDNVKGENVEVKIQDIEDEYDNQIYVNQRSVEHYVDLAIDLIKRYDFIALKAYGNKIHKAILIAGLMSEQFSQLKQINIPRTVNVSQTTRQVSSSKKRAAITIELSLKKLNKRHIGYQESYAEPREQYNEKQNSKYVEKTSVEYSEKPKYIEKPAKYNEKSIDNSQKTSYKEKSFSNNRGNNKQFKEKEEDERALR